MTQPINIQEKILQFGINDDLVGILSGPTSVNSDSTALIIINAGLLHRTGACRSAVSIARKLAKEGYFTLRFDLHGVGDSAFGGDASDDPMAAKKEISQAMDAITAATGIKQFVLHGLCSGARDSFYTAIVDDRVVGISMIDGHAYRDKKFYFVMLGKFLQRPGRWLNAVKIRLFGKPDINNDFSMEEKKLYEETFWPEYPDKKLVEDGFNTLANRQVKILATYTGTVSPEYNHENQFYTMYSKVDFKKLLTINYMPSASHTMTIKADREQVANKLLTMLKTF